MCEKKIMWTRALKPCNFKCSTEASSWVESDRLNSPNFRQLKFRCLYMDQSYFMKNFTGTGRN